MNAAAESARRVVTGLDAQGRSCVILDGPIAMDSSVGGMAWQSAALPADNSGNADAATRFDFELIHRGGSAFMLVRLPPDAAPYMHATDTLDYIVVIAGEIVLMLETGETVLRAGDFLVDRGVQHAMRNDSGRDALMAVVTLPAHPVGRGRTV